MSQESTILVVDDEPDLLENIGLALEVDDYNVLTAADGSEALALLESESVDLILADIAMPNMNGYQFYERVRENPKLTAVPFIFLSARTMDSDIRYGKELGVDDYLTKPIRAADLLAAVRGKLRRARQLAKTIAHARQVSDPEQKKVVQIGPLRIDSDQHRTWQDDKELQLSAKEFALLERLAQEPGSVLSVQELLKSTHNLETDHVEAGSLLRPIILTLRRKLGIPTGKVGSVENVRGVGYRLAAPD